MTKSNFIHPSGDVMKWMVIIGIHIKDVYRMTVKRIPDGSAELTIWRYAVDKEGKRYTVDGKAPEKCPPEMVKVLKMPDFVDKDLYGEPLESI